MILARARESSRNLAGWCGRWFLEKLTRPLDQLAFFWVCLKVTAGRLRTGPRLLARVITDQIYFTGVQSLEVLSSVAFLVGGVVAIEGLALASRFGGRESLVPFLVMVIVREVGPLATAVIVTLRSGSAVAVEIGYMSVLGEMEGLEMQGIHPFHLLALPRLAGVALAVVCLFICFGLVAIVGGFLAAWAMIDLSPWRLFYDLGQSITGTDLIVGLSKALAFGLTIPLVCLYHGFRVGQAVTTIPPQVSRALVDCFIYCIIVNIIISALFYL